MGSNKAKNTIERLLAKAEIKINGDAPGDIQVHNEKLFQRVLAQGSIGLGEAYMDGWWDVPHLDDFFYKVFKANLRGNIDGTFNDVLIMLQSKLSNMQTRLRSRKVAHDHYDLGNDLYMSFLDPYNQYTCGYFKDTDDLNVAQEQKLELICKKLQLSEKDHVLDIGCGWGGFAKYAATHYGCKVTGITISDEQYQYAQEYCAGLSVTIKKKDYRELDEDFDKVLICGMIEHVGYKNYRKIMEVVHHCLKEGGMFLLHTIGSNNSAIRYFRDKLAMRMKADDAGIRIPPFTSLFHDGDINHFADTVAAPWIVKPRAEASATGMKKIHSKEELWAFIHNLGEERHRYLVEQFKPGDVYHADSLTVNGEVVFCRISKYLNTPFEVAHGGGIFRSSIVEFGGQDDKDLQKLNKKVMNAFGMKSSASHTEFIKAHEDGKFYFLETSSRVGGAHLAEMVEASSDINLWAEWAKLETAMAKEETYQLPEVKDQYAGIIVSLSRFQHPDSSGFNDPEICWRLNKEYHIGMIVAADNQQRVFDLLDQYAERIHRDFHASAPAPDKPLD